MSQSNELEVLGDSVEAADARETKHKSEFSALFMSALRAADAVVAGARLAGEYVTLDPKIATINGVEKNTVLSQLQFARMLDFQTAQTEGEVRQQVLDRLNYVCDLLACLAEYYQNNEQYQHAEKAWHHCLNIHAVYSGIESQEALYAAEHLRRALIAQGKKREAAMLTILMTGKAGKYVQ
ncbi:MAG TPA: hypothetical protein V6D17_19715 [Candidatus Obscuribacterales bacterium]